MLVDFFFSSDYRESIDARIYPRKRQDESIVKVKALADNDYHMRKTISIVCGYYRNRKSFEQQLVKVGVQPIEKLWDYYYKKIMRIDQWTNTMRYDLQHIPYMLDRSYDVTFHYKDKSSGRTWPDIIPTESVVFDKASDKIFMRMWFLPEKVCVARYTGAGFLEDHKYFTNIEEAVNYIENLLNQ